VRSANVWFERWQSRFPKEPPLAHFSELQAQTPHEIQPSLALVQLGEADLKVDRALAILDELNRRPDILFTAQRLVADCNIKEEL
jgi:hypothetical protein